MTSRETTAGGYATPAQLQMAGDAAQVHDLTELRPQEIPALRTLREPEPVGRATIVGQVAAQLRARTSVQLYGPAGIGKKAIARAVIRELRDDAVRGVELRPRLSQENTLTTLCEQLAGVFFHVSIIDPAEEQLWTAARGITALVVIYDCELPADQVGRLLATFPGCVFLLTSERPTIGRAGAAREIEPLDQRSALALVTQELGHDPVGLQQAQAGQACDLAAGQVQRLLLYAAFLRSTEWWPGHRPLPELTVTEVATVLAGGLSGPARQVLVALATFGTGLPPDLFAAVTGLTPQRPGEDLRIAAELLAARLVSERGSEVIITADANAAVRATWPPASAQAAAQGLLPLLTSGDAARPVSADLLVAVARQLAGRGEDAQLATRFIRAAAPAAMRARQTRAWIQLIELGLREAAAAGSQPDREYFLQEEHTRALFQDDKAAAGAAVLELLSLQRTAPPPPSVPVRRLPGRVRHWLGAHSAAQIGAMTAVTAVLAAAAFVAGDKVVTALHSGHELRQLTGTQLAAALLPQSGILQGGQDMPGSGFSTGDALVPYEASARHVTCQILDTEAIIARPRQTARTLGLTAGVRRAADTKTSGAGQDRGDFVNVQQVLQSPGPAQAEDLFQAMRSCAEQPPPGIAVDGVTELVIGGGPAFTYTQTRPGHDIADRVVIALDGPDVFELAFEEIGITTDSLGSLSSQERLMGDLIARVRRA
jgi:hypothetical protein